MDDSNDPDPSTNATDHDGAGLPGSTLPEDDMFEALAHQRRRYLLYTFLEDGACSLHDLATKLAAWEDDSPVADVDPGEVEQVYASLFHAHVPKLVDLGIVEFDREEETITRGPNVEQVLDVLEHTGTSRSEALERHARGDDDD